MKTSEIKVDLEYLYKGEKVTVISRIKGCETTKDNMQSGVMFTGKNVQENAFY